MLPDVAIAGPRPNAAPGMRWSSVAWNSNGSQFRSLMAGVYRGDHLVYVGNIGTGFGAEKVSRLMPALKAAASEKNPFGGKDAPRKKAGVHWLKPELVAEIEFAGFTGGGMIRQATFKGLRQDKPAREVEAERPAPSDTTDIAEPVPARTCHPGQTFMGGFQRWRRDGSFPEPSGQGPVAGRGRGGAVTKLDLARYFEDVGTWMMGHLKGRPCSIIRAPDGIGGQRFFQRHSMKGGSNLLEEVSVSGDRKPYVQIDRIEGLAAVAQSAGVELHPWNNQPGDPALPGRLVFDLGSRAGRRLRRRHRRREGNARSPIRPRPRLLLQDHGWQRSACRDTTRAPEKRTKADLGRSEAVRPGRLQPNGRR